MRDNAVYNRADNEVMVRTNGDEILIICNTESQMDKVVQKMTTDTCKLAGYEEWDDSDTKYILTFIVCDIEGASIEMELN